MLNLITLGGLTIRGSDSPLDSSRIRKPLALLAVVAAAGENGVSRDRLQALLWPESDANRARGGLKQAQYLVRQTLGVDPFSKHGLNVVLDSRIMIADLAQFHRYANAGPLREAAAVYGGPFLDGVYLKDAPEFEQWVDSERSRLAAIYARTLERLAANASDTGDVTAAAEWWRRRAGLDQLDCRVARLYFDALLMAGDRDGAVRHARAHTALVRAELGAEPDPEFLEFTEKLRALTPAAPHLPDETSLESRRTTTPVHDDDCGDSASVSTPPDQRRSGFQRVLVRAAGGLALAALAGLFIRRREQEATRPRAEALDASSSAPQLVSTRLDEPEPARNIGRVLITPLEDETHDPSETSFGRLAADWMASGLGETGLVDVVDALTTAGLRLNSARSDSETGSPPDIRAVAATAHAKLLVVGRYFATPDSLVVQVMIEDAASGRVVQALPVIGVRRGEYAEALALIRARIAGAFATMVDPRLESLVDRSTPAPSLSAYQAYAEALDCYLRRWRGKFGARVCNPVPGLQAAIRADSSWTLPYLWLMYTHSSDGDSAGLAALINILDRRKEHRSELDRSGIEFFRREQAGDLEGALRAARRAAALAPRSNWTYQAGYTAMQLGRYREAFSFLRQLDPEHGWIRGWWPYIQILSEDEHMLGDYHAELRDIEAAERRDRGAGLYVGFRLIALAGLGDSSTMLRVIDSLIANPPLTPRLGVILNAVQRDVAGHGHLELAQLLADRCLAAVDPSEISTTDQRTDLRARADCLYSEGRWSEAKAVFERLLAHVPSTATSNRELSGIEQGLVNADARLNDSAGVAAHMASALARSPMANRAADSIMMLAHIAAIRGMNSQAVELLRRMPISAGWQPSGLHRNPDFQPLATYPPFRALVGSRD